MINTDKKSPRFVRLVRDYVKEITDKEGYLKPHMKSKLETIKEEVLEKNAMPII